MSKFQYIKLTWSNGKHFGFSRFYRVKQIVLGWRDDFNVLTEI